MGKRFKYENIKCFVSTDTKHISFPICKTSWLKRFENVVGKRFQNENIKRFVPTATKHICFPFL